MTNYYSDNGVDIRVQAEFADGVTGYACDVGANNGVFLSNSLNFEERGWTVLCVEPNPLLEAQGRERRKLWRSVAAGSADEIRRFWAEGSEPYASSSRIDLHLGEDNASTIFPSFDVQVLRLDRILEEAGFPRLDYLTVDVEGWEPHVMAGFTIERWKPKIIVLESWTDDQPIPDGYERIERKAFDNIYRRLGV